MKINGWDGETKVSIWKFLQMHFLSSHFDRLSMKERNEIFLQNLYFSTPFCLIFSKMLTFEILSKARKCPYLSKMTKSKKEKGGTLLSFSKSDIMHWFKKHLWHICFARAPMCTFRAHNAHRVHGREQCNRHWYTCFWNQPSICDTLS